MLKEALEFLTGNAVKAVAPTILKVDNDPRRVFVNTGNELKELATNPRPRQHFVDSLQDLILAADTWGHSGIVWHNHAAVVLVVNDNDRYDSVTFPLVESHAYTLLAKLESGKQRINQRDFIQLLRHDLAGGVPTDLLPKIRKIESTSSGKASSEVQHGRERGTREFQAEIAGAANIPELLPVTLSVYSNVPELPPVTVGMSLDITLPPQSVDFLFLPLPDALANVMRASQTALHAELDRACECPVFFGTP